MNAGSAAAPLRILPTRYRADLLFWHCHQHVIDPGTGHLHYPAESFNPVSRVRFSAAGATPPRAMWYGSQSASAAIWETLLRDVIGDDRGGVLLPRWALAGWRLTPVRSRRDLLLLPLLPGPLRRLAPKRAVAEAWLALTQTPNHAETHAPISELLALASEFDVPFDGLVWHSRQAGSLYQRPVVGVLYAPPASADDLVVDHTLASIDLADPLQGDPIIAAALAEAGLWRYPEDDDAIAEDEA